MRLHLFDAAEVALALRKNISPEHGVYLKWVEFEVPAVVGNFGTRPRAFRLDEGIAALGIEQPAHADLTGTGTERGHAVAQELSGGDPDVARALMVTSNMWPMTGLGSTGVNQGAYRDFERAYVALKADNPGSSVHIRVAAVVGEPRFVQRNGRAVLWPRAFDITVTFTSAQGGAPLNIRFTLPN
jgi:hypothetical protein